MKRTIWWLLLIAGLALLAAIPYYSSMQRHKANIEAPDLPVSEHSEPAPPARPAPGSPLHPLPLAALETPLPALDTSDATMRNNARALWGDQAVEERFHFKDFVRRVVATVDNLPRRKVAQRLMPVKRADGAFLADGDDSNGYTVAPDNAARYAPYVALLESVTPAQLVSLYTKLYPLFQRAYEDLGYPGQYFNDRLVVVIDDLLAAPELDAPAELLRPKVFYVYADPDLESRSAGQKIMMRMGGENGARVKARLRAIRAELKRQAASVPAAR